MIIRPTGGLPGFKKRGSAVLPDSSKDWVDKAATPAEKAMGTLFAAGGAFLGRVTVPLIGAALGSQLGGFYGGAAGLALGAILEFRNARYEGYFPVGRVVGGLVGGIAGATLGGFLDRIGIDPTWKRLRQETSGFSLTKLPGRLADPSYTSHPTLSKTRIADFKARLQTGDVLITNHDKYLDLEIPEVLLGIGGAWTHTAIYIGNGEVVESLWGDGVLRRPVDELLAENHHARILRPAYTGAQAREAAAEAIKHVGKPYDARMNPSDEGFGCVELVHKAVTRAAPQIDLTPHRFLGKEFLSHKVFNRSPDMKLIEDTGSSFFYNYLSKFS